MIARGAIGLVRKKSDVFEISKGLAEIGWKTARWLYRKGSSGGVVGAVYNKLRASDTNQPGLLLKLMGQEIVRFYREESNPLLVAHPTLVTILRGRPNLIYQHGELIAPDQALVEGAAYILVPTQTVAERFIAAGYREEQVIVTGLCIEPPLVRQAADSFQLRLRRFDSDRPLTAALFSSGAEPTPHIEKLIAATRSLIDSVHRAIVFAEQGGKLEKASRPLVAAGDLTPLSDRAEAAEPSASSSLLVSFTNRRELNAITAKLFPQFDLIVSPAHERVNWALGLGLPIFLLEPSIGPFAPLNRDLVLARGCGLLLNDLDSANKLGETLASCRRSGDLTSFASAGWGKKSIEGFANIAAWLQATFVDPE